MKNVYKSFIIAASLLAGVAVFAQTEADVTTGFETIKGSSINAYGNGSSIFVTIDDLTAGTATIYDITGAPVKSVVLTDSKTAISGLKPGVYFILIDAGKSQKTVKAIVD